jgi:hypothetical protein
VIGGAGFDEMSGEDIGAAKVDRRCLNNKRQPNAEALSIRK